jgi:hypothetical protein
MGAQLSQGKRLRPSLVFEPPVEKLKEFLKKNSPTGRSPVTPFEATVLKWGLNLKNF